MNTKDVCFAYETIKQTENYIQLRRILFIKNSQSYYLCNFHFNSIFNLNPLLKYQ